MFFHASAICSTEVWLFFSVTNFQYAFISVELVISLANLGLCIGLPAGLILGKIWSEMGITLCHDTQSHGLLRILRVHGVSRGIRRLTVLVT